jgi:hypothetical protein
MKNIKPLWVIKHKVKNCPKGHTDKISMMKNSIYCRDCRRQYYYYHYFGYSSQRNMLAGIK